MKKLKEESSFSEEKEAKRLLFCSLGSGLFDGLVKDAGHLFLVKRGDEAFGDGEHHVYAAMRRHSNGPRIINPACNAIPMCIYGGTYTHSTGAAMRTNIDIDDALLSQAMAASGLPTKRATVEEGLRHLVRLHEQAGALADIGGLGWEGDLDEIRRGRPRRRS